MKIKLCLILACIVLFSTSIFSQTGDELLFSPKGIAEVHITLLNGKEINDIKNEKNDKDYVGKLDARVVVKNSATSTYSPDELFSSKIQIDGRGNTTWGVPKKPYNIDLIDDNGAENPAALLGMPAADEWALLAFWHDRSLMRIPLAMYLGQKMSGIKWTPRLRYVEVWVNEDYRGLYCLSEKIERGDDRIKIKKLTNASEDQVMPRIAGGYILEGSTEGKMNEREKAVQFRTSQNINFTFKYPKAKNVTPAQREWIKNYLNEFEAVLWDDNLFKDPVNGYQKYIDEESFIDWTILHEMSKGVDNLFHASTFVHKDRDGKLHMSAPWDFDLSYGNGGDRQEVGNGVRRHRWFDRLSKDERYLKKYNDRYEELMPLFDKIPQILEANYKQLEEAGCIDNENITWPQILWEFQGENEQVTPYYHKAHVKFLSDWIESRNAWCYMELGMNDQEKANRLKKTKPVIRIMDPEGMSSGWDFDVKVMEGYSYIWNDIRDRQNNVYRIREDGRYWVQIKDDKGNVSLPSKVLVVGDNTAINEINKNQNFIFSSPVKNNLIINYSLDRDVNLNIRIFNINGQLVKESGSFANSGNGQLQIDIASLTNGIYLVQLITDLETISKEIIAKK